MKEVGFKKRCINCGKIFKDTTKRALCTRCTKLNKEVNTEEKIKIKECKLPYKFHLFVLSSENLPKFIFLNNRRKISQSNVYSLARAMKGGNHFDSPIVVSEENGLYYVIDGNHRIEAFKQLVSKYSKFRLEVLLVVYNKLEDDERIQIFRRWNVGRPQSTDDFIQSVAHNIPILSWVKKEFPVSIGIYKQPNTIHVRPLFNGYLAAKRGDQQGHGFNKVNFVGAIQNLNQEDYEFLKEFVTKFVYVFGEPHPKNPYYRTTFLQSILYVAHEYGNANLLFKALADRVRGDEELLLFSKLGGREANKQMIQKIRDKVKLKPILKV